MKNSVNRSNPGAPSQQGCLHFRLAETSSLRSEVTRVFRFVTLVVEEVLKQLDPLDHLIYGSTSSRHHSLFKLTFGLKTGSTSSGGYEDSWKTASTEFRNAITSDKWVQACSRVRQSVGKLIERKLISRMYQKDPVMGSTTLKGDYVTAQFATSFANLRYAIETVTFNKDTDGQWRADGYFIKPK